MPTTKQSTGTLVPCPNPECPNSQHYQGSVAYNRCLVNSKKIKSGGASEAQKVRDAIDKKPRTQGKNREREQESLHMSEVEKVAQIARSYAKHDDPNFKDFADLSPEKKREYMSRAYEDLFQEEEMQEREQGASQEEIRRNEYVRDNVEDVLDHGTPYSEQDDERVKRTRGADKYQYFSANDIWHVMNAQYRKAKGHERTVDEAPVDEQQQYANEARRRADRMHDDGTDERYIELQRQIEQLERYVGILTRHAEQQQKRWEQQDQRNRRERYGDDGPRREDDRSKVREPDATETYAERQMRRAQSRPTRKRRPRRPEWGQGRSLYYFNAARIATKWTWRQLKKIV